MGARAREGLILVVNAGSSSIKFALFDDALHEVLSGVADAIGGAATLKVDDTVSTPAMADHGAALEAILAALAGRGISPGSLRAAAHRVVHGGRTLTAPVRITSETRAEIARCASLAPLHNPHNLAAIDTLADRVPELPQFASFDTAFHATNPEVAQRYALPDTPDTEGLRRYGFHGQSYSAMVSRWTHVTGTPLPARLLAFHLGNGASICAIENGRSVATTMGYSPLEGLTMGTRCGSIDGNAVLRLVETVGRERAHAILNTQSGLLGLSGGVSDMRALMADPTPANQFAVDHFCYWALRHAGSLVAALRGVDAIAFTGGIGENAREIRTRLVAGLDWLGAALDPDANSANHTALHAAGSGVGVWVIPAEEERMLAADALRLLTQAG